MRKETMNVRCVSLAAGAAAALLSLAACGGGSGSVAPSAAATSANASSSGKTVPVRFSISIPHGTSAHTRQAQYISTNTANASVSVNSGMGQVGTCTSGTCVVTVDAPVGPDTFSVILHDSANNVLSTASTTQTISGTIANTVSLAFGGVPKTVTIAAATTNLVPGTLPSTSAITVAVMDASGATIVGSDPYVDASSNTNPITLTDSDSSATSLAITTLNSPADAGSTLNYTGNGVIAGNAITISATATGISATPATVNIYAHHTILEYPLITPAAAPNGITPGPDGNEWFTEQNGHHVGKVTMTGVVTEYPVPGGTMGGIATGADGNLWVTDFGGTAINRVTPTGTVTTYTTGLSGGSSPDKIVKGPSNDLYFGEFGAGAGGRIGRITTSGSITESAVVSGTPQIEGVAFGADGRLWFAEPFGGTYQIGAMTVPAFSVSLYNIPGSAQFRDLTLGPDANIWYTDSGNGQLGKIDTSGTVLASYGPASSPSGIVSGSDGHLYFADGTNNTVGQITTAGVLTPFTVPTAGSDPYSGANGPDGNYWFVEFNGNKVGRFVL